METISIKLEGLSRKDRKKAIKMIKSTGRKWFDKDRFKDVPRDGYGGLFVDCDKLWYNKICFISDAEIQLPQDFDKLKEFLGIKEVEQIATECPILPEWFNPYSRITRVVEPTVITAEYAALTKQLIEAKKKNEALDNLLAFHRSRQDALLKRMRKDLFRDTEFKNLVEDDIRILNESYDKINIEFK